MLTFSFQTAFWKKKENVSHLQPFLPSTALFSFNIRLYLNEIVIFWSFDRFYLKFNPVAKLYRLKFRIRYR